MDASLQDRGGAGVFFLFEMFKLFRLLRFKRLLNESLLVKQVWEKINIETALAIKFTFLISLISHWIACLWSLIAFLEARSFGDPMLESLNWISNVRTPRAHFDCQLGTDTYFVLTNFAVV